MGIHYPVHEIPSRVKLSCCTWNSYMKSNLIVSDYEGTVTLHDVAVGAEVRCPFVPASQWLLSHGSNAPCVAVHMCRRCMSRWGLTASCMLFKDMISLTAILPVVEQCLTCGRRTEACVCERGFTLVL